MLTLYNISLDGYFLRMLKAWNNVDPPDKWEIERNSLIEEVQGNRNPFIDDHNLINTVKILPKEQ
jgi:deoxyribonuclease-1